MKVKISYTIDDSEIPNELAKFLEKTEEGLLKKAMEINKISDFIVNNFSVDNLGQYYNMIGEIRKEMVDADTIMSDCQDILVGMHQIVEQQKQEELVEAADNLSPPPVPPQEGSDE
tara:strand:- start:275 stop:622 length:348 start_codon:yes stop_codon:yes gene_type:complete